MTQRALPPPSTAETDAKLKSRTTASLLAIFLGVFGAHKFYLGNFQSGCAHLALFVIAAILTNIIHLYAPISLVGIACCAEGLIYILKDDKTFQSDVVENKRWFA